MGMNELALNRINSLMQLRQEVESLASGATWVPAADWIETNTELVLIMDVPGVTAEALELEQEDGHVTIRGSRPDPEEEGIALQTERPRGGFARILSLPVEITPGSGQAKIQAGVLVVRFDKRHKIIDQG